LLIHLLILVLSFAIILAGSEMFTNGIEWAGQRLKISEAAVGSLLAAVGTALPETFIPAVALLSGPKDYAAHSAVGVGAIMGAPLMLSTLALFVMGIAAIGFRKRRARVAMTVPPEHVRRDLGFFIPIFLLLTGLGLLNLGVVTRRAAAVGLLLAYGAYSVMMLRLKRAEGIELAHGLYFEGIFGRVLHGNPHAPRLRVTLAQVIAGVLAILIGANAFVDQIVRFAHRANLNPGVLSLILSPLATELPEKYNSVVWIRQSKDHLAVANITGAMVFQSCIPVALGLAFSRWHLTPPELLAGAVGLVSSTILFINVRDGELGTPTLMIGGIAYGIFLTGLALLGLF
jgi:cation:H+ antiporter